MKKFVRKIDYQKSRFENSKILCIEYENFSKNYQTQINEKICQIN